VITHTILRHDDAQRDRPRAPPPGGAGRNRATRSRSSRIRSIQSSGPASVPMNRTPNTLTTPRLDRRPLILRAAASKRAYAEKDTVEL